MGFFPHFIPSVAVNHKTIISAVIRLIAQTVQLLNRERHPAGITFVVSLKEVTFFGGMVRVYCSFPISLWTYFILWIFLRRKKSVMDCVMKVFEMEPNESYLLETCLRHCPSGRTPTCLFTRRGQNSNEKEATSNVTPAMRMTLPAGLGKKKTKKTGKSSKSSVLELMYGFN